MTPPKSQNALPLKRSESRVVWFQKDDKLRLPQFSWKRIPTDNHCLACDGSHNIIMQKLWTMGASTYDNDRMCTRMCRVPNIRSTCKNNILICWSFAACITGYHPHTITLWHILKTMQSCCWLNLTTCSISLVPCTSLCSANAESTPRCKMTAAS